jgi:transcriptional regulator with XRE-family HTH domain
VAKDTLLSSIGSDLRRHRKERHITQAELAARAGLSVPTVRQLERTRGHLASWNAALAALGLEIVGRNLPQAETFGRRIATLRRRRGFSQRTLAALADVTPPTKGSW